MRFLSKIKLPLIISILTYVIFFCPLLKKGTVIYSGKDSTSYHYQSRIYLHEKLKRGSYPWWSERVNMGYPIYADMERGYLNPINVFLIKIFGPYFSYKLLHLFAYLLGSLGLYYFLKKYKISTLGFFASNLVYYFSFFHLYHQQHFNLTLTTYLLPLALYLFSENKLLTSVSLGILLSFCFYLGSFQALLILFIALSLYYFVYKKPLQDLIVTISIFLVLIIPGLLSTLSLYLNSVRNSSSLFLQGSFSPIMLSTLIFPFIFNSGSSFMGAIISREYYMHEVYIYPGLTSLVLSFFGYFLVKDLKLKKFIHYLVWFFAVLAFIKFIPILKGISIIPFSFFRYWVRSSVLLVLGISILVGHLFTFYKGKIKVNFKIFLPFGIYFFLLEMLNFGKTDLISFFKLLIRDDYTFGITQLIWVVLVVLLVLLLRNRKTFSRRRFLGYAITLLFVDILIFGKIAFTNGFKDTQSLYVDTGIDSEVENGRIIDLSGRLTGNNSLVNTYWNLMGYTVLVPKSNSQNLLNAGFTSLRYSSVNDSTNLYGPNFESSMSQLGVRLIILPDETHKHIDGRIIDHAENLVTKEGNVYGKIFSNMPTKVHTKIMYYPGWKLKINGQEKEIEVDNLGFISFFVNQGLNEFKLTYKPVHLFLGLKISALTALVFIILIRVLKLRYEK